MMLFVFASYTVFRVAVLTATLIRLLNTIQYKVLLIDGISKLGENFDYKKDVTAPHFTWWGEFIIKLCLIRSLSDEYIYAVIQFYC